MDHVCTYCVLNIQGAQKTLDEGALPLIALPTMDAYLSPARVLLSDRRFLLQLNHYGVLAMLSSRSKTDF